MKRLLILTMTAILLFTTASSSATTYFSDTNEHWAEEYIDTLQSVGVMKGDGNNALPNECITRAEFAALIARAFLKNDEQNTKQYFDDVPQNDIFAPYISAAYENGIVNGIGNGKFLPNNHVTREEIILMISRLDIIPFNNTSVNFADIQKNYKYMAELKKVVGNGIVLGYDDGKFYPGERSTRAQTAAMIVRAMRCTGNTRFPDKSAVEKIVVSNFSDPEFLLENTIGAAHDDTEYRLLMRQDDVTVKVSGSEQTSYSYNGMFSEFEYLCNVSYQSRNYNRTVSAIVNCKYVTQNDETMVYDISTRLSENEPINLAWDISAQTPISLPNGLTHISPSAYVISDENQYGAEISLNSSKIKLYNRLNDNYIKTAHDSRISVWPMYKTDFKSSTASAFMHNNSAANAAIGYLRSECVRIAADGINLDFENMYQNDSAAYADHVKKLTLVMHDIGVIVSADITRYEKTSGNWSMCYDRNRLAANADYIMIMAYDQYYAGSKTPGPVASLPWTEDTIRLTLREVPSDKLILGIPFYVRYWESKNGTVTASKAISMQTAQDLAEKNGATVEYSEKDGMYTAVWHSGGVECKMWLESAQTIFKRRKLAKNYSLAGTAAWRLGLETADIWNN